jgi:hypothetical protein
MRLLMFILVTCILFISCFNNTESIKDFQISTDFYFKAKTIGNRGYTWLYLCKKNISEQIDIYGLRDSTTSSYFMQIESVKINNIKGDTVFYTIIESAAGNKFCIVDSLLLSKRKVLSKETIKSNCP